ncbi:MAG: phosphate-binding protein [Phycisphaeraceae bacterium]|nr:MAG: phosphate-binding protein [Phycisphaeraceae bacterium]
MRYRVGFVALSLAGVSVLFSGLAGAAGDEPTVRVDRELPAYASVAGISGDIKTVGSDTMLNLMSTWAEEFGRHYPGVRVQVEGKGSSTAPPALLEGQAQFGPMSRAMDPEEMDEFRAEYGYEPTEMRVAIDCVAVFVNKDCPVEEITLDQLIRVFSVAGDGSVTWGELGATDPAWRDRPVSVYGRNSASGTYKFFKKTALDGNDFKPSVKEQPGSSGVIQAIANDVYAMGYSGVGYSTPGVRALRVSLGDGEEAFAPTADYALSGDYPMARFLYVYMNRDPRTKLDPLRAEFARMIFSREGQEGVLKDGSYPVTAGIAREELENLGLEPGF